MQTEEWFYLHPERPCDPFLQLLGKLGLVTQELCPLLKQKKNRESQRVCSEAQWFLNHLELVTWLGQKKRSGQKKAALTLWRELEGFRASCRQPAGSESRTRLRRRRPCPSTSQKAPATTSLDHARPVKERIKEREEKQKKKKIKWIYSFYISTELNSNLNK